MSADHKGCLYDHTHRAGWHAHCWADGHGVWHARVTFPGGDLPTDDAGLSRVRAFARRSIRSEISQRANVRRGWRCAVTRAEVCTDPATGAVVSIEYRERADDE